MTILEERLRLLESLELKAGSHKSWEDGACAMEELKLLDCRCLLRADGKPARGQSAGCRLWGRVRVAASGCWEFAGGHDDDGYGVLKHGGVSVKAHRLAWLLTSEAIPDGLRVLHRCDNPPCVRPSHLFLGSVGDNNRDRANKGRSRGTFTAGPSHPATLRRGERHWQAKLSDDDVSEIRRRHAAGETQDSLGREFGIHPATVSRIVRHIWRKEAAQS